MELTQDESALIIGGGFWKTLGQICGAIACLALVVLCVVVIAAVL